MSITQNPPAPPRRLRRTFGCLALLSVPLLLLAAMVMAPVWISDYRLGRMVDRIQEYPLPPGTEFGYFDPDVKVTGDSGDCWYTIRFELSTDRPVQEVLDHYQRARIEDPDGEFGDYTLMAWTPDAVSKATSVIVDLDGTYSGTWVELRCM